VLRSQDPEGVAQEMWACSPSTRPPPNSSALASTHRHHTRQHQLPPRPTRSRRFPANLTSALAMFLLKILDPSLPRPSPTRPHQPRKTKKAGDYPRPKTPRTQHHPCHPPHSTPPTPTSKIRLTQGHWCGPAAGRERNEFNADDRRSCDDGTRPQREELRCHRVAGRVGLLIRARGRRCSWSINFCPPGCPSNRVEVCALGDCPVVSGDCCAGQSTCDTPSGALKIGRSAVRPRPWPLLPQYVRRLSKIGPHFTRIFQRRCRSLRVPWLPDHWSSSDRSSGSGRSSHRHARADRRSPATVRPAPSSSVAAVLRNV